MNGLPNIASIPPGAPFLPTLVDALFNGTLISGFVPEDDPLALASVTIWVPTRRAARSLAGEFLSRFDGDAALLPVIRTLGDADDDGLLLDDDTGSDKGLDAVINPLKRHLILSQLVNQWSTSLAPKQRDLYRGHDIIMPSSLSDAVWFSAELAKLMDTVATEEAEWTDLNHLVPDDHAEWWQLTLEFLKIATQHWPAILSEIGMLDGATQRGRHLHEQAQTYTRKGSAGPVIAAGSTGSIPATAELLKAVAHMDNGIVVLPALDRDLDNQTWEKIDLPDNDIDSFGTTPGHPQFGLKKLLSSLGTSRNIQDIVHLGDPGETANGPLRLREKLVSEALRPPHSTGQWQTLFNQLDSVQVEQALEGISLVEAETEREEALAIALALRETLESRDKTAALVTPDRNLARRVAVEMQRFGISVDDSAGQPLRNTPVGKFVRLILLMAFAPTSPIVLTSLLKHPLALFGQSTARTRRAGQLFELAVLRGSTNCPRPGQFQATVTGIQRALNSKNSYVHRSIRRLSSSDWSDVAWLAGAIDAIFGDAMIGGQAQQALDQLTRTTIGLVEKCAVDAEGHFNEIYGTETGRVLTSFLADLLDHGSILEALPSQWPDVFDALMGQRVARSTGNTHPRVSILGPLEARLQTYDRVVLGGLNEKTWPATTRNDPFLSRPMKSALNLPPPERRTGLAAHDFQVLMGIQDVVLTRSVKSDNAPSVASRWVQRLSIVAGKSTSQSMHQRGKAYLDWARQLDLPDSTAKACKQPKPRPPLSVRPEGLSITEIETWIADPYAIYARHILNLSPLDPLIREPDAREKGVLYHAIMEDYIVQSTGDPGDHALDQLLAIGRGHFHLANIPPDIALRWWPRFELIAASFANWHREHLSDVQSIHVELKGGSDSGLDGFTLRGRADRIDVLHDGRLVIFDYKTGTQPVSKSVINFESPQLPLEAALALRGGFGSQFQRESAQLGYVRLRPTDPLVIDLIGGDGSKSPSASKLGEEAWDRLATLVAAYRDPTKDYRSKARQSPERSREDDYDHLARVREWSISDDGDDEK